MNKFAVLLEHKGVTRVVGSLDNKENIFQEFAERPRAIDLLQVMINYDLQALWVAPGHLGIGAADTKAAFLQHDDKWDLKSYDDNYLSSVHGYKRVGKFGAPDRQMRSIIWPEFTAWRWSPEEAPPFSLLLALGILQDHLGVAMAGSPPMVARKMFIADLEARGRQSWMVAQPLALMEQYPWGEAGKDAVWKRQFSRYSIEKELRALLDHRPDYDPAAPLYVIAVDKSSTFPAASQSTAYGAGDPVEWSAAHSPWSPDEHGKKPGLWHIYAQRPIDCEYDGINGPSPLYGTEDDENLQEWVTTPLLELLKKQGWGVQIYEGIYWPRSRRLFEDFAPAMWRKRQHFKKLAAIHTEDGRSLAHYQLAYDSTKRIMNSFFGMFASAKNRDKAYLRRDIWATTVEAAKANIFYNIDKIKKETDAAIIGVITDCLVIVTQKPTAAQAFGSLMNREDQLGGYKVKWELLVDAYVLAALAQRETSDMMHDLNSLAARQMVGD